MIRIGIDPGVHECGVAIEWEGVRAAFIVRSKASSLPLCAFDMRDKISFRMPLTPLGARASICVEGQQVYRSEKSKGDPNDMIKLAVVAGVVLTVAGGGPLVTTAMPLPRQWKGNTPKKIHHARLARDYPQWVEPVAADTPPSLQHHVWDAVGLLEWHRERSET